MFAFGNASKSSDLDVVYSAVGSLAICWLVDVLLVVAGNRANGKSKQGSISRRME